MENCVLTEAAKKAKKNNRKYKCPYCETRLPKEKLITHIEDKHEDMIPEGYTGARIVFNMINKKECGHCVQCKKETAWNENTWRYERFCSDECAQEYSKIMKQRMINTYGKEHLLNDPEQQKMMLKHRSISGTYKFQDGGRLDYCGSYELKLLEFFDKVLNVRSRDLQAPGPVIEYKYNGENLFWITDLYYVPANLVFDVKDGGDNPNNREMQEYREKQYVKEEAIRELNKYNYIRLTDNNFQQLLLILAELKMSMMDEDNPEYIIRINEFMVGTKPKECFIVTTMNGNTFSDTYAYIDDEISKWYKVSNNKLIKINPTSINAESCNIFKFKGNGDYIDKILKENYNKKVEFNKEYFYETLTGKDILSPDQIMYDKINFKEVSSVLDEYKNRISIFEASINMFNDPSIPILNYKLQNEIQNMYPNIELRYNWKGYFAKNIHTENTTPYVNNISELSKELLQELNNF